MAQIKAAIANKEADTAYKQGLLRYKPWKVALTASAGTAAALGALLSLLAYLHH